MEWNDPDRGEDAVHPVGCDAPGSVAQRHVAAYVQHIPVHREAGRTALHEERFCLAREARCLERRAAQRGQCLFARIAEPNDADQLLEPRVALPRLEPERIADEEVPLV